MLEAFSAGVKKDQLVGLLRKGKLVFGKVVKAGKLHFAVDAVGYKNLVHQDQEEVFLVSVFLTKEMVTELGLEIPAAPELEPVLEVLPVLDAIEEAEVAQPTLALV